MRRRLARFIKRWSTWWYGVTVFLYAAAIPITVWVFPATTIILSCIVLFGGFTASLAAFATAIVAMDESEE